MVVRRWLWVRWLKGVATMLKGMMVMVVGSGRRICGEDGGCVQWFIVVVVCGGGCI